MPASIQRSIRSGLGRSAVLLVGVAFVASCNAATSSPKRIGGGAGVVVTAPPVAAPVPSASASAGDVAASDVPASPLATAVATTLDPCQLVTPAEVNQLTGDNFGAGSGQESTTEGHAKICSYGAEGTVFQVIVGVAPDVDTAKAGEQQAEADLQKAAANGLKVTELPGFADGVADVATLTRVRDGRRADVRRNCALPPEGNDLSRDERHRDAWGQGAQRRADGGPGEGHAVATALTFGRRGSWP